MADIPMTPLQAEVILRLTDSHDPAECSAWMDKAERRCGKPGSDHLCPRHVKVAMNRLGKTQVKAMVKAELSRDIDRENALHIADLQEQFARVDAEIHRLWGLPHHNGAVKNRDQQRARSDGTIDKLVKLGKQRDRLLRQIASGERGKAS